ncbi:helix-turn-helix domain-containing protein [Niallia circulans]|uniref:helix-turn-helix domain-containing protein n=1 Tax=Niallia circulans TaxID=1397 RepID=UPI0026F00C4F|nr:helix-turn-helix transcriptional regulator [Niallia circulans]
MTEKEINLEAASKKVDEILDAISMARLEQAMSQTTLEKKSGVQQNQISRLSYLKGEVNVTFKTVCALAEALGLEISIKKRENDH